MTSTLSSSVISRLKAIVGSSNLTLDPAALASGSKDSYHFSPVLIPELDGKLADAIVRPQSQEALWEVIKLAVAENIPITPRGAGTGNYGQGVPIRGGLLVNTKQINGMLDINADHARVECGTILWQIEKAAAQHGAELRIFPSTLPTSTSAGFVAGGSGGVGSISWGMLSDNDNVRAVKVMTVEAEPQILELTDRTDIADVLHNCGLTAFVTEVEFALAPKRHWHQYVLAFKDIDAALRAGETLAYDQRLPKRLCSVFEWPIPSYFSPLVKRGACPEGQALLFLMSDLDSKDIQPFFTGLPGTLTFHSPPETGDSRGFQIYDFSWNHTTMWAMKADKGLTYLQDSFDPALFHQQIRKRKEKFGDQLSLHIEFLQARGQVRPGGLSVVRYKDKQDLWEIIAFCESIGIRVANPHTHFLDEDSRWYAESFLAARKRWDPKSLLNPGHLRCLEQD